MEHAQSTIKKIHTYTHTHIHACIHTYIYAKECTASSKAYKCINCLTYNKHNQNKNICDNHSSLDKKYPSLQAILEKYRQNTDY